ncbi:MAG: DUF3322 domain-containing protein, partial [Campylobacterota bacterium]|nr:DUF3322 domain-containing protein [Campylobacterota bacterium]
MPKFYNIEEIFQKVLKIYTSGKVWKDFIVSENLFPLEIKLKKVKQIDIRDNYSQLIKELNSLKKEVFEMEYQEFHFKSLGTQKLPIVIHFRERKDFLSYISKEREFEEFVSLYQHIVLKYPLLKTTLLEKPSVILENSTRWDKLFLVYDFFIKTPQVNIYIRELNIEGIDTKFIERNRKILDSFLTILLDRKDYKEEIKTLSNYGFEKKYFFKYPQPLIRFRILDTTQTIGGLSDISTPVNEFKSLELLSKNIFIVENKITTLSFPPLKNSTVIFGSGYGVEVLKNVDWLEDKNIFYWGDIDSDGF